MEESSKRSFLSSAKANGLQLCIQAVQACVGLVILVLGLLVGGAGLWAFLNQGNLLVISDGDPQLSKLPLSMMVAGVIVSLLGLVGVVGGVFARTVSGRILIGVYAFVLVLLIINEIGAGVSAIVFRDELRMIFVNSSQRSLSNYGNPNHTRVTLQWDKFQTDHYCCGAANFTSYRAVFNNNTVPASCCQSYLKEADCTSARLNVTMDASHKLHLKGCPDSVIDTLDKYHQDVAIVVIVFGAAQLAGVLLACFLVYASSRADKKTTYSYKLIQVET